MILGFGNEGSVLKAFTQTLATLVARSRRGIVACGTTRRATVAPRAASSTPPKALSPEAEAALALLDLPPDGPFDPRSTLRTRLAPDAAARNFVSWARALDLVGHYSRRSIYALYCEFSEVDDRPPLADTRFLDALALIEGIRREQVQIDRGTGKIRRVWQWTIEPAAKAEASKAPPADTAPEQTAVPAPCIELPVAKIAEPIAAAPPVARPLRPAIFLPRFVPETEHPFSPAALRDQEKSARRARLYAAASRKQRGALRRAA